MTQQLTQELNMISSGWDVYGSDNDKIGSVDEVGPNYLVVRKGLIFTKDVFVPHSAIDHLDTQQTAVFLNVPKSRVEEMGWDDIPTSDTGWTPRSTDTDTMRGTDTMASPRYGEGQARARGSDVEGGEVAGAAGGAAAGGVAGGAVAGPPGAVVGGAAGAAAGAVGGDKVEDAAESEAERDRRTDRR